MLGLSPLRRAGPCDDDRGDADGAILEDARGESENLHVTLVEDDARGEYEALRSILAGGDASDPESEHTSYSSWCEAKLS
jgi:hypothetical protein